MEAKQEMPKRIFIKNVKGIYKKIYLHTIEKVVSHFGNDRFHNPIIQIEKCN